MAGRFISVLSVLFIFSFSLQTQAVEFRGAEYDVYLGDVNGDGVDDIYLKVPDIFVLLHGDISVPLLIESELPSYLISSVNVDSPFYAEPVIDASIDISQLTMSNGIVRLEDVNADGIPDLVFDSPNILHSFALDGDLGQNGLTFVSYDLDIPVLSPPEINPSNDILTGAIYYGTLTGEYSVSNNGAFTYSVPIDVAPGINGVQPQIALSYSSDALSGLVGWGWNISGLSSIGRCRATYARDGYVSGITSGDDYRFCLDGERLVEVDTNEYRTERESFRRVTKLENYWLVENPDGSKDYYGSLETSNSKQIDSSDSEISWMIDKKQDVSGNYILYVYESETQGAGKRIKNIAYTKNENSQDINNSIDFIYEARPDIRSGYRANTLYHQDERLSRIESKVNNQILYTYQIAYEVFDGTITADPAKTSRVATITKCFSGVEICAEPISFDWTSTKEENYYLDETDNESEYIVEEDISGDHYWRDIDGDGQGGLWNVRADSSVLPDSSAGQLALLNEGVRGDFDGDGKNEIIWLDCGNLESLTPDSLCDRKVAMDKDSAGVVFAEQIPVYQEIVIRRRTSNSTSTSTSNKYLTGRVIDINSDGLDDYYIETTSKIDFYISNGSTLELSSSYSQTQADTGATYQEQCCAGGERITAWWTYGMYFRDVTGDKLPDLVRIPTWLSSADSLNIHNLGIDDISVAVNNGTGFDSFVRWGTSTSYNFLDTYTMHGAVRFTDVSGDGLSDLVGLNGEVGLNTGSAFEYQNSWTKGGLPTLPSLVNTDLEIGALSMGGLEQIARTLQNSSGLCSIAGRFCYDFDNYEWHDEWGFYYIRNLWEKNPHKATTAMADVNGDGLTDLVAVRDGGIYVALANGEGFADAVLWSTEVVLSDLTPFCNMMECNTQRRGFLVEDINKDGLADFVFTEAWFGGVNQNATKVSALYSLGYKTSESGGFSAPIVVAEVAAPPEGTTAEEVQNQGGSRLGKPMISSDGEFLVHYQPNFMDVELNVMLGMSLVTIADEAVSVGTLKHKILEVREGAARLIDLQYQKLSNSEIYTQSALTLTSGQSVGIQGSTTYPSTTVKGGATDLPNTSFPAAYRGREVIANMEVFVLGEESEAQSFHYFNQKRSRDGFGSLGFESIEKTLSIPGETDKLRTVEEYYQEVHSGNKYALVAPKSVTECVISSEGQHGCGAEDSTVIKTSRKNWKVRTYDSTVPHYYPYLYEEESKSYGLVSGSLFSTINKRQYNDDVKDTCPSFTELTSTEREVTTDEDFDSFGTPLDIVETRCDAFGITGTHTDNDNVLNDGSKWCLNLVQDAKVHTWIYDAASTTQRNTSRHSRYTFNATESEPASPPTAPTFETGRCQIGTETREPDGGADIWMRTDYGYNNYGSVTSTTETVTNFAADGAEFTSRTTSVHETFDSTGIRTVITSNALAHPQTEIFNAEFGSVDQITDANDLITTLDYDAQGRLITQIDLGITTSFDYRVCTDCFEYNPGATWYTQEKAGGQTALRTYYDGIGRDVGTRTRGLGGTFYYTGKKYNARGLISDSTVPFSDADRTTETINLLDPNTGETVETEVETLSPGETRYAYDFLGREVESTFPTSASQTIGYSVVNSVLTITTTDTNNRSTEQQFDALMREKRVEDALNGVVSYLHDAQGNITDIEVASETGTNAITHSIGFDLLGRKVSLQDPDTGNITYTYNAYGHLSKQANPDGINICYEYDKLDRQIQRSDGADSSCNGGTLHSWVYDREGELGFLAKVSGRDTKNQLQEEEYDYTLDRLLPETISTTINGEQYVVINHYDGFNRQIGFSYPTGFTVEKRHDDYGVMVEVRNAHTSEVLWSATDDDARGNITEASYGNELSVVSSYKAETGLLESRTASIGTTTLQNHVYTFDNEGNLRSRTDLRVSATQQFCYDALYRLTDQVVGGSCSDVVGTDYSGRDYAYDIHGNLTRKEGIDDYQYGGAAQNAGPHAVSYANGSAYNYDDAGRLIGNHGRTIDYSAFGKPTYMGFNNGYQTEVVYGVLQNRVQRNDIESGQLNETVYIGKDYERIDLSDGTREHRHYLGEWGVHVIEESASPQEFNVYITRDHIGSVASKSDDRASQTIKYHANEPWGRRQNESWSGVSYDTLSGNQLKEMTFGTGRGFTDHEHLDGVGLIHMNGRVYDAVIGRFVSPDPWIQDPKNSQSFNRYSYVWNNPLRYTDPTGECATDDFLNFMCIPGMGSVNAFDALADLNAGTEAENDEPEEETSFAQLWSEGLSWAGVPKDENGNLMKMTEDGAWISTDIQVELGLHNAAPAAAAGIGACYLSVICGSVVTGGMFVADPDDPLNWTGLGPLKAVKGTTGLADDALVVRGGAKITPESIVKGTGTHPSGVTGFSAQCNGGACLTELGANVRHNQMGVTTVGQIRGAGGDVLVTSGKGNHVTVTNLKPDDASALLSPSVPNPVPKPQRNF